MQTYEVNLKWTGKRKGVLSSPVLPQSIEVATPPHFPKGMEGIWSPEHLFLAAINGCVLTTFLAIAENSKLEFTSFESKSSCIVGFVNGKYTVTEIILKPKIVIPFSQKQDRAKHVLQITEKSCLISNAVRAPIRFEPEIFTEHTIIPLGEPF